MRWRASILSWDSSGDGRLADAHSGIGAPYHGPESERRLSSLLYGWLAWQASRRWAAVIVIVCILIVDLGFPWQRWGFTQRALLDEPCHLATGLVCLGAITRFLGRPPGPGFGWSMLICANAIDLDHLPQEFGSSVLTAGTPRPYTHALWVVVALALGTLASHRRSGCAGTASSSSMASIMFGATCGVSEHFLRDIATAKMSLWWPVTSSAVEVPYWWYVTTIVVMALVPVTRRRGNGNRVKQPAHGACSPS